MRIRWIVIISLIIYVSPCTGNTTFATSRPTCTCDLTENLCDGSCCFCDPDCEGEFDVLPPCKANEMVIETSNPFLTQVWNTSSYLGHYHKDPMNFHSLSDIYLHLSIKSHHSVWSSKDFLRVSGIPLRTAKGDFISLPQNTYGGECATNVPIRYLRGFKSTCTSSIQREECIGDSKNRFDPQTYLKSSKKFKLLYDPNLDSDVPIHIEYNLSRDPSPYLDESTFPEVTLSPFRTINHMPLKSKDHKLYLVGNICNNVVLEARYWFVWSGFNISSIRVDILLGKLTLSPPQNVHQFFEVIFHQNSNEGSVKNIPHLRHGLRVPIEQYHGTQNYLRTFGNGNSCIKEPKVEVLFGQNVFTSCSLVLQKHHFQNCSSLRDQIESSIVEPLLFKSILVETLDYENVTSVNVTYQKRDLNFSDSTPVICEVPIHFHVEFLYSKAKVPILKGVKLSIRNEHLKWLRTFEDSYNFEFFHSIHFQETAVFMKEENYSRFWREQSVSYCSGESCWKGIFHLFTEVDELEVRTKWTLVLGPCLLFYLWFNKSIILS